MPISAPFDGTVGQLLVAPGQVVPAGATLFELENLNTMWVRVPVYVGDMHALGGAGGAAVEPLGPQGGARRRPARRVTGPPSANAQATSADLFFEVANGDRAFRPGERVSVLLTSAGASRRAGGAGIGHRLRLPRRRVDLREDRAGHVSCASASRWRARSAPTSCWRAARLPGAQVVTAGVAELFGTEFGAGK